MIDWSNLFMNGLWILGTAIALATLSLASWDASVHRAKFRDSLRQSHIQIALNIAGFLFSAGLAGSTDVVWQRILWILLSVGFLIQIGIERYREKSKT